MILSLTWVLAAVPQWATEWIAKYATCFHLFAWSLPALQTLLVVLFGAVEGDPITGICYVGTTNVGFQRAFVLGKCRRETGAAMTVALGARKNDLHAIERNQRFDDQDQNEE